MVDRFKQWREKYAGESDLSGILSKLIVGLLCILLIHLISYGVDLIKSIETRLVVPSRSEVK